MYDFDVVINRRNVGAAKWEIIDKMGADGKDIIALSVADMEFKVAPEIVAAIKKTADFAVYGYTIPTDDYYQAVMGWMKRRHNWEVKKEWISLASGVVPAINTAIRAFTNHGDKVIIQQPVYYPFESSILQNGCQAVNNALIYKDGHYTIDYDDLERKAKDPLTKILLFCNPHNPVGRVWTEEEIRRVGEICINAGVLIISDEIHFDFSYKPNKHTVFASLSEEFKENSLILTSPSKTFNLAGLQVSNIIIPNSQLKSKFDNANLKSGFFSLNHFAYAACEAAYNEGEQWLNDLLDYLEGNLNYLKNFMMKELPQIKVIDTQGTYLVWLDCRALGLSNDELEKLMREKARIFLDDGYIFGAPGSGFERINIACSRVTLELALKNIKEAIDSIH